jgi:hypothetical protein
MYLESSRFPANINFKIPNALEGQLPVGLGFQVPWVPWKSVEQNGHLRCSPLWLCHVWVEKTHHSCIELCEEHYPVPNLLTDLLTNCWTCMNMSPIISIFSNDGELARYLSMMCCWSYDHLITLMHGNCYLPVNQIRTPLQQKHIPYIAGSETFITPILIVHQWFPFTIPNPHVFIGNKHAANISNHPHISCSVTYRWAQDPSTGWRENWNQNHPDTIPNQTKTFNQQVHPYYTDQVIGDYHQSLPYFLRKQWVNSASFREIGWKMLKSLPSSGMRPAKGDQSPQGGPAPTPAPPHLN